MAARKRTAVPEDLSATSPLHRDVTTWWAILKELEAAEVDHQLCHDIRRSIGGSNPDQRIIMRLTGVQHGEVIKAQMRVESTRRKDQAVERARRAWEQERVQAAVDDGYPGIDDDRQSIGGL